MRYPAEHKEETRERIVRAASRHFRRRGPGVGVAELMKASKLTHGGFYRHFKSKDELFAAAIDSAFDDNRARIHAAVLKAKKGQELRAIIETYLSDEHCAQTAGGCPVAALAQEVGRHSRAMRRAMEQGVLEVVANTAPLMPGKTEDERRECAMALFSAMSGSLTLARAVDDKKLRQTILAAARKMFLKAFGDES